MRAPHKAWYCAALSDELTQARPLSRRILDQPLALFRDEQGTARAVSAVCPHRGADLARGRIERGSIACPMHGWCFDGSGACVRIPSQPRAQKIPEQVCVPTFQLRESQGIAWIWMGEETPEVRPPCYARWEDGPRKRRLFDRPRLWRCSFVNAVENAIDIAHSPFVHRRTLGTNQPWIVPRQQITVDQDQRGFTGRDDPNSPWTAVRPGGIPGGLAAFLGRMLGVGDIARQHYRFDLGGSVSFDIEYERGTFDVLFGHATPADDTHTWFFGGSVRSRALHSVGDALQRGFMMRLSDEDAAQLTTMWSNAAEPSKLVSVSADAGALAFRKLWERAIAREARALDASQTRVTQAMQTSRSNS